VPRPRCAKRAANMLDTCVLRRLEVGGRRIATAKLHLIETRLDRLAKNVEQKLVCFLDSGG